MTLLNLKARLGIRDHWDKAGSPLQKSMGGLRELLGYEILAEPEWRLLLADMGDIYPDERGFVATVSQAVEVWCKSMTELLADETNEKWTETLLTYLQPLSHLRLLIEVANSSYPSTSWSKERSAFVVNLPRRQVMLPTRYFPTFMDELLGCFEEPEKPALPLPERAAAPVVVDDGANPKADTAIGKLDVVQNLRTAPSAFNCSYEVEYFPDIQKLERPDQLFLHPLSSSKCMIWREIGLK
ncbi:uncharacterized protein N7446_010498 [Penicillium canescens]|uniref:uncharacterized protein n=1 Tax=Penicillium canescens TaxID=5083 RepID=UPI0026DF3EA6|nr:uncharacterized protein N7446_010498 [Penicillium canescens]KAJ6050389.1 hypothetical protein N7446_010498 [Penicillium canescens]